MRYGTGGASPPSSSFVKNGKVSFENIYKTNFWYMWESISSYTLKLLPFRLKFSAKICSNLPPSPYLQQHSNKKETHKIKKTERKKFRIVGFFPGGFFPLGYFPWGIFSERTYYERGFFRFS